MKQKKDDIFFSLSISLPLPPVFFSSLFLSSLFPFVILFLRICFFFSFSLPPLFSISNLVVFFKSQFFFLSLSFSPCSFFYESSTYGFSFPYACFVFMFPCSVFLFFYSLFHRRLLLLLQFIRFCHIVATRYHSVTRDGHLNGHCDFRTPFSSWLSISATRILLYMWYMVTATRFFHLVSL
jgi:hypothetical protein